MLDDEGMSATDTILLLSLVDKAPYREKSEATYGG
jgi:hypothetical protein